MTDEYEQTLEQPATEEREATAEEETEDESDELSWRIREFQPTSFPWLATGILSLIAVGIGTFLFLRENYFGGAFFVILPILLVVSHLRQPRIIKSSISHKGVRVDGKLHRYEDLQYFSFVDNELVLQPKEGSPVYVPIHEGDEDVIADELGQVLPEEDHDRSLTDIVAKLLKMR